MLILDSRLTFLLAQSFTKYTLGIEGGYANICQLASKKI